MSGSREDIERGLQNSLDRTLDLSGRNMGDFTRWDEAGVRASSAVLENSQVHTLNLSNNLLYMWDEVRIKAFSAGLEKSQVQTLDLRDNYLGLNPIIEPKLFVRIPLLDRNITHTVPAVVVAIATVAATSVGVAIPLGAFFKVLLGGSWILGGLQAGLAGALILAGGGVILASENEDRLRKRWYVSEEHVRAFFAVLENSQVHALDLSNNLLYMWDEARITAFSAGLKNSQVRILTLSNNHLNAWDEARITAFFAGLKNSQVQILSLSDNYLDAWDEVRFQGFLQAIQGQSSLIKIEGFTGEREQQINAVLKQNFQDRQKQVTEGLEVVVPVPEVLENIIHEYSIGTEPFKRFGAKKGEQSLGTPSTSSSGSLLLSSTARLVNSPSTERLSDPVPSPSATAPKEAPSKPSNR